MTVKTNDKTQKIDKNSIISALFYIKNIFLYWLTHLEVQLLLVVFACDVTTTLLTKVQKAEPKINKSFIKMG